MNQYITEQAILYISKLKTKPEEANVENPIQPPQPKPGLNSLRILKWVVPLPGSKI